MSKPTKSADSAQNSNSTKIYSKLEEVDKKIHDNKVANDLVLGEIMKKLNELIVNVSNLSSSRPARGNGSGAGSKGGAAAGNGVLAKKKFPNNSMTWFKEAYKADAEETSKMFFQPDQLKVMQNHMETDEKDKVKVDDAKVNAEIAYLWSEFVMHNDTLRKQIKAVYDEKKKAYDAATKTPVKGEKGEDEPVE